VVELLDHPQLSITLTGRDLVIITGMCLAYAGVVLPLFLKAKGFM
jgi:hypothetical protein